MSSKLLKHSMPQMERSTSASFRPETVNEAERTIEVVMSTGEGVMRYPWWGGPFEGESYLEELEVSKKALRTARLDKELPMQLDHRSSIDSTVGVIANWRIQDGKMIGDARFSNRNAQSQEAFDGAREGVLKDFSLRYKTFGYDVTKRDKKTGNAILVRDWEPLECSLVAIPAETGANSRAADGAGEMNTCQVRDLCADVAEEPKPETKMDPEEEEKRAQEAAAAAATATPTPTGPTEAEVKAREDAARAEGAEAALKLRSDIDDLCGRMAVDDEAKTKLLACTSIEDARAMAIDLVYEKDQERGEISTASRASVGTDIGRESFMRGFENKVECELDPTQELNEYGKRHAYRPLVDQLREMYPDVRDARPQEVFARASSGQFPELLGGAMNRVLLARFKEMPSNWGPLVRERKFKDFREVELKRRTGMTRGLEKVNEGGEYKFSKFGEQSDSYGIDKYGQVVSLTFEMMQDDDLGAFRDLTMEQMELAVSSRSDLVWALLTDNPTMGYDSTALFHADHGNIGTGGTISKTTLNEARKLMQKQTSPAGRQLNILPQFIMIPPDIWEDAQEMLNEQITPTKTADTNYWNGRLQIISEARLSAASPTAWYLSSGATLSGPTLEYGVLSGYETPHMEREKEFLRDGIAYKIRDFFGVKAVEHRGLFTNAGA